MSNMSLFSILKAILFGPKASLEKALEMSDMTMDEFVELKKDLKIGAKKLGDIARDMENTEFYKEVLKNSEEFKKQQNQKNL